jgi:molybdopterin converting factor small subunit
VNKVTVLLPFFVGRKVGKTQLSVHAATVGDALRRVEEEIGVGLDASEHLFFLNNRVINKDSVEAAPVANGDKIRIVVPMAGG